MPGPHGPLTTAGSGRELLSMGALVLLLEIAFVTHFLEPIRASGGP